jgi:hypothetical protein
LVFAAATGDFSIRDAVVVANADRRYLDPLAIYMPTPPTPFTNQTLRDLPVEHKRVAIPYQTSGKTREPASTHLIWPVACAPR